MFCTIYTNYPRPSVKPFYDVRSWAYMVYIVERVVHGGIRGTWAVFDQRDFVPSEAVESIDELLSIGFQGVEIADVKTFAERVKRGQ